MCCYNAIGQCGGFVVNAFKLVFVCKVVMLVDDNSFFQWRWKFCKVFGFYVGLCGLWFAEMEGCESEVKHAREEVEFFGEIRGWWGYQY